MNSGKVLQEARVIMLTCFAIGIALFGVGAVFKINNLTFVSNNNALIGLSFIPLSLALVYYYKISMIRKHPDKMRETLINESDERIVALKNEVDTKAFKIVQGAIVLAYFGYTFIVPADVFESVGWWILLILLFLSFVSQGIMGKLIMPKSNAGNNED